MQKNIFYDYKIKNDLNIFHYDIYVIYLTKT